MLFNYYYWYFTKSLSDSFCKKIIKEGLKETLKKGTLKTEGLDEKKRNADVVWLNDTWIYKEIHPYVHKANKMAGWNFEIDWCETCQFTSYKKNQFYDWHMDTFPNPYDDPKKQNYYQKIRKLSVIVSLSNPRDYKGGELEFDYRNHYNDKKSIHKCNEISPQGSIVVFPSSIWHRVGPILSGKRYSLVMWYLGKPWR